MDNKKIGKLIATLRKQNNLTQQDLGDKVGVGFRAVSKWERGINLPDIGIINDVSKVLGITTDELLKGEIKTENKTNTKKKLSLSIKITISVIIFLLITIPLTYLYFTNKTYTYNLVSANRDEYYIEGQMEFKNKHFSITINQIGILDKEINSITIKNYEYEVKYKSQHLYRYGYHSDGRLLDENTTIENITGRTRIHYTGDDKLKRKDIIEDNITLKLNFIDENNNEITKEIDILLYPKDKK